MKYLHNIGTSEVFDGEPWDLVPEMNIPDEVRGPRGKGKKRDKWIGNPETKHVVYSVWEGVIGNLRIKKGRGDSDEDNNPPAVCHGIMMDIDFAEPDDKIGQWLDYLKMQGLSPMALSKSLSGKWHIVWKFQTPVNIAGFAHAEAFLQEAVARLNPNNRFTAHLDKQFFNPCVYLTASDQWHMLEYELSAALGQSWAMQAVRAMKSDNARIIIPLDKVREELMKDPRFANSEWADLEFVENQQGPSWWVEGAQSGKSAIVKLDGFYTFSSHASRAFYSWSDFLGADFIRNYRDQMLGQAVDGIYYDTKIYWVKTQAEGTFIPFPPDPMRRHLSIVRGLNPFRQRGDIASEVDEALAYIEEHRRVDGAGPSPGDMSEIVKIGDARVLNTWRDNVCRPAKELTSWGPSGRFPFLSAFFGAPTGSGATKEETPDWFLGEDAIDSFLGWLKVFYQKTIEGKPMTGHSVFIGGPPNRGKSFLVEQIMSKIFGGIAKPTGMLMGDDAFGGEAYQHLLWVVDDAVADAIDRKGRMKWQETLKALTATPFHECRRKHMHNTLVKWMGRVMVLFNDNDDASSRVMLEFAASLEDKYMTFRVDPDRSFSFPDPYDALEIMEAEVPYFLRWLVEWEIPEAVMLTGENATNRFGGLAPRKDEELAIASYALSEARAKEDVIVAFLQQEHEARQNVKGADLTAWEGTALELACQIKARELDPSGWMHKPIILGRTLGQMAARQSFGFKKDDPRWPLVFTRQHTRTGTVWRLPFALFLPD